MENNIRQRLRPRTHHTGTAATSSTTLPSSSSSSSSTKPTASPVVDTISTIATTKAVHATDDKNNNDMTTASSMDDDDDDIAVVDATPPFHTILVYGMMVMVLLYHFPNLQQLDDIATIQVITKCQYFSFISIYTIATVRVMCTIFIVLTLGHMISNRTGWYIITPYLPKSKLKKHVSHHMVGIKTLYPFTSWSFVLLGLYFTLASYITIQAIGIQQRQEQFTAADLENAYRTYNQTHRTLLRCTIVLWEISAPCTILIAVIVRYVMWPAALRRIREQQQPSSSSSSSTFSLSTPAHTLNSYQNICMHNINVLLALVERCLLSGLPVRYHEWTYAPLYGCVYVLFSWNMVGQYSDRRRYGPHFIYFFLDTTLPGYFSSYALMALLLVLLLFYSLYCSIASILYYIDHTIVDPLLTNNNDEQYNEYCYLVAHVSVVVFICSLVMRFRD